MARSRVRVIDRGWNNIVQGVNSLSGGVVKVGFPTGGDIKPPNRRGSGHSPYQNIPELSLIAFDLEYGTSKFDGWPFMRNAMDHNLRPLTRLGIGVYRAVIAGRMSPDTALGLLGEKLVAFTRRQIRNLRHPPNAPLTIALKKSDNPLIDTGQMVQSVQRHVVLGGRVR